MKTPEKTYVGDGVYVEHDGFGLVLTTEDGYSTTNRIVLEPDVLKDLVRFARKAGMSPEIEASREVLD